LALWGLGVIVPASLPVVAIVSPSPVTATPVTLIRPRWVAQASGTPAQPQTNSGEFPPNPLEITTPDPLLPNADRPLTAQEQRTLIEALDNLNTQAIAQSKAGNGVAAYEIWNRELRLRRALGPLAEVKALGRVGGTAWEDSQATQVRLITERLQKIQAATPPSDNGEAIGLRRALGEAYLRVRNKDLALGIYTQTLAEARQRQDATLEEMTLTTIADLHLNWFDYPNAAEAYQALLPLVTIRGDILPPKPKPGQTEADREPIRLNQADVLRKLSYAYEQNKQPAEAIVAQQQLVTLYQRKKQADPIPALKLAIAINYEALGKSEAAIENYQQSYLLAQPVQQYAYAADALQRLGTLYRTENKLDSALRIYQFLVDVEQQSYNVYGKMNAFDQIAQIHLARKNYPQALAALQQGLTLAKQLKYREDYFNTQIQKVMESSKTGS